MSRSYKKPYVKDQPGDKRYRKRSANRVLRREGDIMNGGHYKKYYCSWNICDYSWHASDTIKYSRK